VALVLVVETFVENTFAAARQPHRETGPRHYMTALQRYVANELTHFVGRGSPEEEQYQTLRQILTSRWLMHPPFNPGIRGNIRINTAEPASENKMYISQVVCFCDIPVPELETHMRKYSPFGISFSKAFLIARGANPVYYVALTSQVEGRGRGQHFDEALRRYYGGASRELSPFLEFQIASFIKFFDPTKTEDDPDNYYMEREWRILGHLQFELRDVHRVIIPRGYAEQFHKDVPGFNGELRFSD
jgi:hypothetical protein